MTASSESLSPHFLAVGEGDDQRQIAYYYRAARGDADLPVLVWLSGYRSDMSGTKALALDDFAAREGLACIRFDYSGHGRSGGAFRDGTISRWLAETIAVLRHLAPRRILVVGSSMGGWISLRLAQEIARAADLPALCGLVLIAPAPDFTGELIEPKLTRKERLALETQGYFEEKSAYSPEPNVYTRALMEDGKANRVLQGIVETGCPVHILQGMKDRDVPHDHALKLMEHLPADDVVLTLIRDGDHRLSRPQDVDLTLAAVKNIIRSSSEGQMPAP